MDIKEATEKALENLRKKRPSFYDVLFVLVMVGVGYVIGTLFVVTVRSLG
jgi:t-SNARE complex subunit (syntaxin)